MVSFTPKLCSGLVVVPWPPSNTVNKLLQFDEFPYFCNAQHKTIYSFVTAHTGHHILFKMGANNLILAHLPFTAQYIDVNVLSLMHSSHKITRSTM